MRLPDVKQDLRKLNLGHAFEISVREDDGADQRVTKKLVMNFTTNLHDSGTFETEEAKGTIDARSRVVPITLTCEKLGKVNLNVCQNFGTEAYSLILHLMQTQLAKRSIRLNEGSTGDQQHV